MMLVILASCKKDPQSTFSGKNGIVFYYFNGLPEDYISYSFKFNKIPKTRDTILLKMRLVGKLSSQARKIKVVTGSGTTAIEGTHFILPDISLPADSFEVSYPVVLLKTLDLDNKEVRLVIEVAENNELEPATLGTAEGGRIYFHATTIDFSNRLVKPPFWDSNKAKVGEYSRVKYEFIISVLGVVDFRAIPNGGQLTFAQFFNLSAKLKNALQEYVLKNGPLIDENGLPVEFP